MRRIILAGLKGYDKLLKESKKPGGRKLHRTAGESSKARARKKIMEKTEWFRDRKNSESEGNQDKHTTSGMQEWEQEQWYENQIRWS